MSGAWATHLLGETVLAHAGGGVTTSRPVGDLLERPTKYIALYFSAHWCPPCRGFTPIFADLYRQQSPATKQVEVVFVSSDRDEKAFKQYFGEMPWMALPYAARDRAAALGTKFGVRGIPSVIVLSAADGSVVSADARGRIASASSLEDLFDPSAAGAQAGGDGGGSGCAVA